MSSKKNCKEDGCEKIYWKKGFCFKHYYEHHPNEKKKNKTNSNDPAVKPKINAPPVAETPTVQPLLSLEILERAMIAIDDMIETYSVRLHVPERAMMVRTVYEALQR